MADSPCDSSLPASPASLQAQPGVSRLRIVHVVSSLSVGGMEQFVLRVASEQIKLGHQVSVVALQGGPLEAEADKLGLDLFVLGGANRIWRFLKGLAVIARLRPQIVNAHNPSSLHYAV